MSQGRFKAPSRVAPPEPKFDDSKVAAFLGGAQVKAQNAELPRPALVTRVDPVYQDGKLVVPDARFKTEIQSDQFVLRFTKTERKALDKAFGRSGYRYLQQYVRSLVLPHLDLEAEDPEGDGG